MLPCPNLVNTSLFVLWMLTPSNAQSAEPTPETRNSQVFLTSGTVQKLSPDEKTIVIQHEAISNFMAAMTMPFHVKSARELTGLQPGDKIQFRLHVTESESWVDGIVRSGAASPPSVAPTPATGPVGAKFTNELGHAVNLSELRGQALAITFFYTRCPLPDACPRLAKNFQVVSQKLAALSNAPTNWRCLSISFDPDFDSPAILRAYAMSYHYDPAHWTFLTGPPEKIARLAQDADFTFIADGNGFNHNFRTLIVDAHGRLQTVLPAGGDLSDQIVSELLKAAAVTNQTD